MLEKFSRRMLLGSGLAVSGTALAHLATTGRAKPVMQSYSTPVPATEPPLSGQPAPAAAITSPRVIRPELLTAALDALHRHSGRIAQRDRIAIADFAAPSSERRFHFFNVENGDTQTLLVAHGSGSDPGHTGWLTRFSNEFGSNASSEGAFLTADYYTGKHGRSQRLTGLDSSNDNAFGRAIVIHGAWYANADMLRTHGKLGRSQGCFAVGENDLEKVFAHLGQGRLLFAAKV